MWNKKLRIEPFLTLTYFKSVLTLSIEARVAPSRALLVWADGYKNSSWILNLHLIIDFSLPLNGNTVISKQKSSLFYCTLRRSRLHYAWGFQYNLEI